MSPDPQRLAYDDMATPAEMSADCRQIGLHLDLERRLARAAETISAKRDIEITEAAQRIANALELHLD
jgi:hypothetical protein